MLLRYSSYVLLRYKVVRGFRTSLRPNKKRLFNCNRYLLDPHNSEYLWKIIIRLAHIFVRKLRLERRSLYRG